MNFNSHTFDQLDEARSDTACSLEDDWKEGAMSDFRRQLDAVYWDDWGAAGQSLRRPVTNSLDGLDPVLFEEAMQC